MSNKGRFSYLAIQRLNPHNKVNKKPSVTNWLASKEIYITIGGIVIAILLGISQMILAKKIGNQQTEIDKLDSIIGQIKLQNKTSNTQIKELIDQTKLLQKQTLLLENNSLVLNNQYKLFQHNENIAENMSMKDVHDIWNDIMDLYSNINSYDSATFVNRLTQTEQLNTFNAIINLLKRGLHNSYITSEAV